MPKKTFNTLYFKYICISGILCVMFLLYSFAFIWYTSNRNSSQSREALTNAAEQVKISIQKQVTGDFQTLDGIAVCLGVIDITDEDSINYILSNINADNTFTRMGLANLDGQVRLVDLQGNWSPSISFVDYDFFQRALKGEQVISNIMIDPFEPDNYVTFYCTPVYNPQNEIVSILCALNSGKIYREIIDAPLINNRGYSSILNGSGDFLIRSNRLIPSAEQALSIFGIGDIDLQMTFQIKETLSIGKNLLYSFKADNEIYDSIIIPLGIEDWSLVSFISESELNKNFRIIAYGTVALVAVASFIFSVLFYQQRKMAAKNHKELYKLAYHDELTDSRNYRKFLLDAEDILEKSQFDLYAVWYCDIKHFKYINDTYGYESGDLLLQNLFHILENNSKDRDILCRISADNFSGIYFYHEKAELNNWFSSILEKFQAEKVHAINTSSLNLCTGFYCAHDFNRKLPLEDMVNRANMAQKAAKEMPGSQYVFFSDTIRQQIALETEFTAEALSALHNKEFVLYFQPKVDIRRDNRLAGAEVLVRWQHPIKGLVPPGVFIPLFEKSGMIVQLDRYIYQQACIWFHEYLEAGHPKINLAINVSRIDLTRKDFVEYYTSVKDKYQIPDHLLELEFTESVMLDDHNMFYQTVIELQSHGIICSLDDFGSGYSSLNTLKNLPIDVLKLDMMFFRHSLSKEREQIVISNVINMASQLHIKTVAEGVETKENVEFLKRAGCDIVQGYIFSKPIPLEEFNQFLAAHENTALDFAL